MYVCMYACMYACISKGKTVIELVVISKSKLVQSVPLSCRQKLPNMEVSVSTAPCDATEEPAQAARSVAGHSFPLIYMLPVQCITYIPVFRQDLWPVVIDPVNLLYH